MTSPTLDFWMVLVGLLILTILFCIWLGINSVGQFDPPSETYVKIFSFEDKFQVYIVSADSSLPVDLDMIEPLELIGTYHSYNFAYAQAEYIAEQRNLEFRK